MTGRGGKNQSDYRKVNRGLVLKLVATGRCNSRAELARRLGLSRMALSNIVQELIAADLLQETEEIRRGEPGRSSIGLKISGHKPLFAGLLIERDSCEAVLTDMSLKIFARESRFIGHGITREKLIDTLYELMDTVLFGRREVAAIGVASIGPVSAAEGRILSPYYFYGIENIEIVRILEERYRIPTVLDHDNQSAALAEALFGAGRSYKDILLLGIGNGIGCGIMSKGERFSNERGLPPEIGHVSIDYKGRLCPCCGSRGCIELSLSTPELLKRLRSETKKMYSYETFCRIEDDPVVEEIFQTEVSRLACAVVNTINILNSEVILLSNDAVYWKDRWIAMLEEQVNAHRFIKLEKPVQVRRAEFGHDSSLMGAVCNALALTFRGELLFEKREETRERLRGQPLKSLAVRASRKDERQADG